ncbi:hypothetical protein LDENG_00045790 [Lucifuga dentata]|nr:hypothetical protein LDENG_00045790 [Lucifuga dentata]
MSVSPAVATLCENPNEIFLDVAKLLLTYADNILRSPNEEKYRSIRIGNPTFSTKLLPVRGAVECLFEMGFEEAETHLVFPKSASVEQLKLIRESIAAERDRRLSGGQPVPPVQPVPTASASTSAQEISASSSQAAASPLPQLSSVESSMSFFVTLQSNFQHVLLYENPELQLQARNHIPLQQLSSAAEQRLTQAREAHPDCKLGQEDFLVLELLRWFKQDFFTWVDCLPCSRCGNQTYTAGSLSPTPDDLLWGAQRVENHYYHVWTEVYSVSQRRWLHCDSCENACDKPLLYEVGWGKKLAYILAFSKDQVVDVTWRYSCNHPEVILRRTKVQEAWLLHTINGLNASRQQSQSPDRKKELTERLLVELVEFISPKKPKPGELGGRNSGSLAWRMARGETGGTGTETSSQFAGYAFVPTEKEQQDRLLHVRYNSTQDQYCRVSNNAEVICGWDQCVWKKESLFRKVENDWQMAYISRTEGSSTGSVSWKFDVAPAGMKIKTVSIMAASQTFQSGKVCWHVQSGQISTELSGDGKLQVFPSLIGSSEFIIVAELRGGEGESSWQHSQLFRQSLKHAEEYSFEILIHLEDA